MPTHRLGRAAYDFRETSSDSDKIDGRGEITTVTWIDVQTSGCAKLLPDSNILLSALHRDLGQWDAMKAENNIAVYGDCLWAIIHCLVENTQKLSARSMHLLPVPPHHPS